MKIKFLGTAAAEGVPGMFCHCKTCEYVRQHRGKDIRTRSQSLINDDLLIDFPADTYMHVLHGELNLHNIHHLIITHHHSDHFYPEDFTMRANGMATLCDDNPFCIYAVDTIINSLEKDEIMRMMIKQGRFKLFKIIPFIPFEANGYKITPLEADHPNATNPLIYLIQKEGKTLLYGHDTGMLPPKTREFLVKTKPTIDLVTLDCCYGLSKCEKNHMGIEACIKEFNWLKENDLINDKTIKVINHFSHNINPLQHILEEHASPLGIKVSYDGLAIEF